MGLSEYTPGAYRLDYHDRQRKLLEMLGNKKKFIRNLIDGLDKTGEDVNTWKYDKDTITLPGFHAAFEIWRLWRLSGQWPLGDWLKQPLSLLAKINAIDMTYSTWRELRHNDEQQPRPRGLASMNATQHEIVRQFEGAADG